MTLERALDQKERYILVYKYIPEIRVLYIKIPPRDDPCPFYYYFCSVIVPFPEKAVESILS